MESWKDINGFEKYYVSSHGRIISFQLKNPKLMKIKTNRYGYHYIGLQKNKKCKAIEIQRLVALNFLTISEPRKMQVDHIDGNRKNNRVENLRWVSMKENSKNKMYGSKYLQKELNFLESLNPDKIYLSSNWKKIKNRISFLKKEIPNKEKILEGYRRKSKKQ